jgi:hypothetical protein
MLSSSPISKNLPTRRAADLAACTRKKRILSEEVFSVSLVVPPVKPLTLTVGWLVQRSTEDRET